MAEIFCPIIWAIETARAGKSFKNLSHMTNPGHMLLIVKVHARLLVCDVMGVWSRGMILDLGSRGRGFNSLNSPASCGMNFLLSFAILLFWLKR